MLTATNVTLLLSHASKTSVGKALLRGNEFEPEVIDLLCYLSNHRDATLFIDVGSNIGFFPLALRSFASKRGLNITIHAHEPYRPLHDIAIKLQTCNNLLYHLHPTAISEQKGTANFYVSAISDSSNSLVRGFRDHKATVTVKVNSLDNAYLALCKATRFKRHIVMIDVETAEHLVLLGAVRLLQQFRPHVICEVLPNRNEQAINSVMSSLGYLYYRFNGRHWSRESFVFGDKNHQYRDWWFVPSDSRDFESHTISIPRICTVEAVR
jgi:FkbM family methyltransferase